MLQIYHNTISKARSFEKLRLAIHQSQVIQCLNQDTSIQEHPILAFLLG
jgi:hypothetical protein